MPLPFFGKICFVLGDKKIQIMCVNASEWKHLQLIQYPLRSIEAAILTIRALWNGEDKENETDSRIISDPVKLHKPWIDRRGIESQRERCSIKVKGSEIKEA